MTNVLRKSSSLYAQKLPKGAPLELPPARPGHDIIRVILRLYALQPRQVPLIQPLNSRVPDRIVRVQRQVRDGLALRDDELREVLRALHHHLVHARVAARVPPRVVDVQGEQAHVPARRPGGVRPVRHVGREERLDVVADEEPGDVPVQRFGPVLADEQSVLGVPGYVIADEPRSRLR